MFYGLAGRNLFSNIRHLNLAAASMRAIRSEQQDYWRCVVGNRLSAPVGHYLAGANPVTAAIIGQVKVDG
jgi:hypothetical protein